MRASLHGDSGGIPGARLHTLTMPLDFASTENLTDYTLLAPPGTVLRGGARYWVVFEVLFNNLYLEATNSADEDTRLEAWSIDNESYTKQASGWVIRPRVIKLSSARLPPVGDRRGRRPRPPRRRTQRPPDYRGRNPRQSSAQAI